VYWLASCLYLSFSRPGYEKKKILGLLVFFFQPQFILGEGEDGGVEKAGREEERRGRGQRGEGGTNRE
jgi:hypothetical protein